jgi:glycosyltransferase involved in cell wall biosynthesis
MAKMVNEPYLTICGTTYQAAKTLDISLSSVINALNKLGLSYEVVIVDNFSTDGTYEKLLQWSQKVPLRVYRYRCSRGLGRALCVRLARGKYIFMIDLDRVYDPEVLTRIIELHRAISNLYGLNCVGICTKDSILRVNYRDLNRAEDVDQYVRLVMSGIRPLPIVTEKPLYTELRIRNTGNSKSSLWNSLLGNLLLTLVSESRYIHGLNEYLRRYLRNGLDSLTGGAYTFMKFAREDYFIWHSNYRLRIRVPMVLARALVVALLLLLNHLRGVERYEASRHLSNHLYSYLHVSLMSLLSRKLFNSLYGYDGGDYEVAKRELINDPVFRYAWTMYSLGK